MPSSKPLPSILIIGGGSVNWTPILLRDLALHPQLKGAQVTLYDINLAAAKRNAALGRKIYETIGAAGDVKATDNLNEGLAGADFILLTVSVGTLEAMALDLEISAKYGFIQTVGDTVGPGGWIRGLRHFPFMDDLASRIKDICPEAWLLNLTNPMTLITRYACKLGLKCIGLCHEVDNALPALAGYLQADEQDIRLRVAGINHFPWIVDAIINGEDGYKIMREKLNPADFAAKFKKVDFAYMNPFDDYFVVKTKMLAEFGWMPFAGDRHIVEFIPWFMKEKYGWGKEWGVKTTAIETRQRLLEFMYALGQSILAGDSSIPAERSREAAADVISCLWFGGRGEFILNIPNTGQIDNLPREAVVECNGIVEHNRYTPLATGMLPLVIEAMIRPHITCQEMLIEAYFAKDSVMATHSLLLDPAINDIDAGRQLAGELLSAHQKWLPDWLKI